MKEESKLIITFVIVVILLGSSGYYVYSSYDKKRSLEIRIKNMERKIKKVKKNIAKMKKNKEKLAYLEQEFGYLVKALPSELEIPDLLTQIHRLINYTGIRIVSITPTSKRLKRLSSSMYNRYEFNMEVVGNFHKIVSFISGLENLERFVSVEYLSMEKGKGKLRLVTYIFKKHSKLKKRRKKR